MKTTHVNHSRGLAPQSTTPATTPGASPSGPRRPPTMDSPLRSRSMSAETADGFAASMAPRKAVPQAYGQQSRGVFSSAGQNAKAAVHDMASGMQHRVRQGANGYAAYQAESHAARYPQADYSGVAQHLRHLESHHGHQAHQAFASASGHAQAFFRDARHGVAHGLHQTAHQVASAVERFNPQRLASQVAHYGGKLLRNAGRAATIGAAGLAVIGGAAAYGASYAAMGAHAMHHAAYAGHAMHHAAYQYGHAAQYAAHQAGQAMMYPGHFAHHAMQALGHAGSAFAHHMSNFNPHSLAHQYHPMPVRPSYGYW